MSSTKYCTSCGSPLDSRSHFCSACGAKQDLSSHSPSLASEQPTISAKSGLAVFLLCLFFGQLGIHRFYVGKIGTGILMLLTGGGLGLWYLYDLISIVCNNFTDKHGQLVEISKNPTSAKKVIMIVGSIAMGFIILFGSLMIFILILLGGVADVAQNQLAAIRSGNLEKAYTYTSTEFQKTLSFDDFKNFINHYPQLKNNVSASFPNREIKNNEGTIIGTIKSQDGSVTPIEYHLIKENGIWKIIYIKITPKTTGIQTGNVKNTSPENNVSLTNLYQDSKFQYLISYPNDWSYSKKGKDTVIFKNKNEAQSTHTIFMVQAFRQTGKYRSPHQVIDTIRNVIAKDTTSMKMIEEGAMPILNNNLKFESWYAVYSYTINNQSIGHLEIAAYSKLNHILYVLDYIAPVSQFQAGLPIIKAMIASFSVRQK